MFEKEAEEIVKRNVCGDCNKCQSYGYIGCDIYRYSKDSCLYGLRTGYNKANEWHWIKDGDFPEEEKEYLIYTKKKKLEIRKIHISGDGKNYLTDVFLMRDLESVIAWKEIVLPKEMKENADISTEKRMVRKNQVR